MTNHPDYETIEQAYQSVSKVVESLPVGTETKRALHHLEITEQYTYQAREKVGPLSEQDQKEA